jgi:hypothetical protein
MKTIVAIAIGATLTLASLAFSADIESLRWDQSNIASLRSFDAAAVATFVNEQQRQEGLPPGVPPEVFTARDVDGFGWADPAGNAHYELLVGSLGPCARSVTIYSQDGSGSVKTAQVLSDFADLKTAIRDLNGDGKDELIVQKTLVEYNCAQVTTWPAVHRFDNGKYVEASRDFPKFYDDEVLPELNAQISRYQTKAKNGNGAQEPASLIMKRDKILRVLSRDPNAGLQKAYQWMNTDDPLLLQDAAATFNDIGGHQEEANAVATNYTRALCERFPHMAICRSAAQH